MGPIYRHLTLLVILLSLASQAQSAVERSAQCLRNGITRVVELQIDSPAGVPCRVVYLRPDEGGTQQILWSASNNPEFCTTKFDSFIVKIENKHAWNCSVPEHNLAHRNALNEALDNETPSELSEAPGNEDPTKLGETPSNEITKELSEAPGNENPKILSEASNSAKTENQISEDGLQADTKTETPIERQAKKASSPSNSEEIETEVVAATKPQSLNEDTEATEAVNNKNEIDDKSEEPRILAALPPSPIAGRGTGSTSPVGGADKNRLTLETLKEHFPPGFYNANSNTPHRGNTELCPADGYFIWNTRDRNRPVFEMGRILEFQIDLPSISSSTASRESASIQTIQVSNSPDDCQVDFRSSYCQYPDIKTGSGNWTTNNRSFQCATSSNNGASQLKTLALFQNFDTPDSAYCQQQTRTTHLALASSTAVEKEALTSNAAKTIDLVVLSQAANGATNRAECHYTNGIQ